MEKYNGIFFRATEIYALHGEQCAIYSEDNRKVIVESCYIIIEATQKVKRRACDWDSEGEHEQLNRY